MAWLLGGVIREQARQRGDRPMITYGTRTIGHHPKELQGLAGIRLGLFPIALGLKRWWAGT
jgi:hypothetical protein